MQNTRVQKMKELEIYLTGWKATNTSMLFQEGRIQIATESLVWTMKDSNDSCLYATSIPFVDKVFSDFTQTEGVLDLSIAYINAQSSAKQDNETHPSIFIMRNRALKHILKYPLKDLILNVLCHKDLILVTGFNTVEDTCELAVKIECYRARNGDCLYKVEEMENSIVTHKEIVDKIPDMEKYVNSILKLR